MQTYNNYQIYNKTLCQHPKLLKRSLRQLKNYGIRKKIQS